MFKRTHNSGTVGFRIPSQTYTTIAIVFGSAAIAVVMARRIAEEKRGAVALGLLVAIGLAIILNLFYELNYVGLPLSLFALLPFLYPELAQAT